MERILRRDVESRFDRFCVIASLVDGSATSSTGKPGKVFLEYYRGWRVSFKQTLVDRYGGESQYAKNADGKLFEFSNMRFNNREMYIYLQGLVDGCGLEK